MDEHIKPADLSYLTPAMVRAARDFVDLKFQIDTVARKHRQIFRTTYMDQWEEGSMSHIMAVDFLIT